MPKPRLNSRKHERERQRELLESSACFAIRLLVRQHFSA
jgi:hypothetical protein